MSEKHCCGTRNNRGEKEGDTEGERRVCLLFVGPTNRHDAAFVGKTWSKGEEDEIVVRFTHRECGHDIGLGTVCPNCGIHVERKDLEAKISEQFAAEREQRRVAYKAK